MTVIWHDKLMIKVGCLLIEQVCCCRS